MTKRLKVLTDRQARRLAVRQQRLSGPKPEPTKAGLAGLVRKLGCVQIDPIRVVERSALLVLWSRMGSYDPGLLDELLYQERTLFEGWAHAASIVHRDHLPIHRWRMKRFAQGERVSDKRLRKWLKANRGPGERVLAQLREAGPLTPEQLDVSGITPWQSAGGWHDGRGLRLLLDVLWRRGEVAIAGREGNRKRYAVAEDWFGEAEHGSLSEAEAVRRAVLIALRALGVATAAHIRLHFTRGGYPGLGEALAELLAGGIVRRVSVHKHGEALPADWFMLAELDDALSELAGEVQEPRTTLLSPFDNLIADRERTSLLWDFEYKAEIYVPNAKRVYGHYVMPILHGSELVGRIDPKVDREVGVLRIKAIHFEPGWKGRPAVEAGLRRAAESLAAFLGLERVAWPAGFGQ